jgi:hypothetical protein
MWMNVDAFIHIPSASFALQLSSFSFSPPPPPPAESPDHTHRLPSPRIPSPSPFTPQTKTSHSLPPTSASTHQPINASICNGSPPVGAAHSEQQLLQVVVSGLGAEFLGGWCDCLVLDVFIF